MKHTRSREHGRAVGMGGLALLLAVAAGRPVVAQPADARELREMIDARVGGIEKLQVPPDEAGLPQPRLPDGTIDPRFAITPEKTYLGKLLFFEPVRSSDIRPEFGGLPETGQTASCGSCHLGMSATKSGVLRAMGVGGEGRFEMDGRGGITVTRTPIDVAGMTEVLPTPVEQVDAQGNVIASGRFDAVDSPGRVAPSVVGFAFNNRLAWAGEAGEPNPEGYPAQEDIVRLASMAHRMAGPDLSHLQDIPAYVRLFQHAFPEEYDRALSSGNLDDLINHDTQFRAIASFLRTVITRNSPWDRFLAGDETALTERQLRGAWLFAADVSQGGANCIACHSGPALNKQIGDEEGLLLEENFHNLGIVEHPNLELARETLGDPDVHDRGRFDVTGNPAQLWAFKTPTVRQARDAAPYFHGGQAASLREVVEYFNAGQPAYPPAGAADSLSPLFTNPLGPGVTGLNLSEDDIDALVDFLENGLYDPGLVEHDPASPTRAFELTMEDLTYSEELRALGAVDGWLPSGLPNGVNDLRSRSQIIFVRGSSNGDDSVDIGDAVFVLSYLFHGGPTPGPMMSADVNDDGRVNIADPIYLLGYLFGGSAPPPFPFPEAGQDLMR